MESKHKKNLSDSGTIRKFMSSEMTGAQGTPLWMAPELCESNERIAYTQAVDVYAFGIILWEFLETSRPYSRQSFRFSNELLDFVVDGGRPIISQKAPAEYIELMKKCWNQDALHRPRFDAICESVGRIALVQSMGGDEGEEKTKTGDSRDVATDRYSPLV
jgi:serine/threonine protein kinase